MLLSASEIINKSLELFKRDFKVLLPYMVLSFVAALLSMVVAFNPTVLLFLNTLRISPTVILLLCIIAMLLVAVFNIWLDLSLVRAIHERLFNRPAGSVRSKFHESRHLLARTIGITLIVSIIVSLPLVLSISGSVFVGFENLVLGQLRGATILYLFFGLLGLYGLFHVVYFSTRYALSYYVVAIDEKKISESLHQGHMLTKGRMGEVLWRLAVPAILFLLIYVLANYIFIALALSIGQGWAVLIARMLSVIVSAAIAILIVIATVILFEDVKSKPAILKEKKA